MPRNNQQWTFSSCLSSSFLSSAYWLIAYDHHILRSRTLWHIPHSTTIKRKPRQLPTMKHFTPNIWVLYQENRSSSAVLWLAFLPLDPTFAGSNPAEAINFKGYIYIRSTPSFGGEVKPEAACWRDILRHVKEHFKVWKIYFVRKN
jgi:hypothetical protein